ncbi:hypothetical protein AB4144_66565, partial [Rhizobiaceae sp. 2RAB30]
MNGLITESSRIPIYNRSSKGETKSPCNRCWVQEYETMMIFMLAAAMTIAMLIATAFGVHQEAQQV